MNEYQWETYNKACQDLRKQNGPPDVENIIKALKKGINDAPEVTKKKLAANGRVLWTNIGALIWNAVLYIIKVQAAAITLCAAIGATVTAELPLVGAMAGARIGSLIAGAYFSLIGLKDAAAMLGQVSGAASVYFEEGVRKAKAGDVDGGAKQFAEGFASILQMIIALVILYCFMKGGEKVMKAMQKTFASAEPRLLTQLKTLSPAVGNINAYFNHSRWGYAYREIKALREMSANDCVYVIRTCNPSRLKVRASKGVALEAKGLEIKGKSFKGGIYEGQVGVSFADIKKLKNNYELEPIKLNPNLVYGPKHKHSTTKMEQNAGYRLRLKEGKKGELDGHILEPTNYSNVSANAEDALKWRLLDKQGNPHIPDMDRIFCGQFNLKDGKLLPLASRMDDPDEIVNFNQTFNQLVGEGNLVNKNTVKHGYTAASVNSKGVPVWHADTLKETLLVFAGGKMFEMRWNEFVLFCDANKALNMPQCFKLLDGMK